MLVILALGAAVVAPALWPALDAVRAEATARRAAAFLDEARRQAVLRRETLTVTCEPDQGLLRVEGEGGAVLRMPERAEIVSCEPPQVRYHPEGYASGGTIVLRDPAGRERRVTVGSFTGLSRVAQSP